MEYLQYTKEIKVDFRDLDVLNLIINGIPSIHINLLASTKSVLVLNLIINGIPSIQKGITRRLHNYWSFKPYYKWNTFNTDRTKDAPFLYVAF